MATARQTANTNTNNFWQINQNSLSFGNAKQRETRETRELRNENAARKRESCWPFVWHLPVVFVIRCSRARSPQQPRNEPNPGTRFRFQNPNYLRHRTDCRTRQFYRHFPPCNEPTRSSSHFGRLKHIFMIYYRSRQ